MLHTFVACKFESENMGKSKVLVVGGTGFLGRRLVEASLAEGHPTYVFQRKELTVKDVEKVQLLLSFKQQGAKLISGSFSDHQSLVDAVKQVDVVICPVAGIPHVRGNHILLQLKLIEAMKEAGNVKRFLPSEYGMDYAKLKIADIEEKGVIDDKITVRKATEEAGIPHTYICGICCTAYFLGNLCDPHRVTPSTDTVALHGAGNVKAVFVDENDVAMYTIKTIDDPRTLNKTVYIRPPENILTQAEVVSIWEKLIGKKLAKIHISADDYLAAMKEQDITKQDSLKRYYQIFYLGSLNNFDERIDQEASELYPQIQYTRAQDYLKRYV